METSGERPCKCAGASRSRCYGGPPLYVFDLPRYPALLASQSPFAPALLPSASIFPPSHFWIARFEAWAGPEARRLQLPLLSYPEGRNTLEQHLPECPTR